MKAVIVKAPTLLLVCGLALAAAADPFDGPRNAPDRWIFGPPGEGYDLRRRVSATPEPRQDPAIVPLPRPRPYVPEAMGATELDALSPVTTVRATNPVSQPLPAPPEDSTPQRLSPTEQSVAGETPTETYTADTPKWATIVNGLACDRLRKDADGGWVVVGHVIIRPAQLTLTDPKVAPSTEEAKQLTKRCGAKREMSAVESAPTPAPIREPVKDNGGAAMAPVTVRDEGGGTVRIEAGDASIGQVLAALQESHLVQFSASDPLSHTVTGTYTGTLPQVLSRILDGYNYFLHVTASGTELHIISAWNDTTAAIRSALSSNVDSVAAPASQVPAASFSLSAPNPAAPKARAQARPSHEN